MIEIFKKLEIPLLLLALTLVVSPMIELFGVIWPISPRNPEWRFGAIGLISEAFLFVGMASLIVVIDAEANDRKSLKIGISLLTGIAAIVLLGAIPLFMLDAVELRSMVPEEARKTFDIAAGKAVVIHGMAMVFLGWLSVVEYRSFKEQRSDDRRRSEDPHPLSLARLGAAEAARQAGVPGAPPAPRAAQPDPAAPVSPVDDLEPVEPERKDDPPTLDLD